MREDHLLSWQTVMINYNKLLIRSLALLVSTQVSNKSQLPALSLIIWQWYNKSKWGIAFLLMMKLLHVIAVWVWLIAHFWHFIDELCRPCPKDWEQHGDQCYLFNENITSWEGARKQCWQQGADLLCINSKDEQVYHNARMRSCIPMVLHNKRINIQGSRVSSKPRGSWQQD